MPLLVGGQETEQCLRAILSDEGFLLNQVRANGETGVDVIATKGAEIYHVEVIGYKSSGPARAKDFYEIFFRAISRLKDGAERCVIAMPERARVGLPARARQYGEAWLRIGCAFPELEIWLVDIDSRIYSRSTWKEWL